MEENTAILRKEIHQFIDDADDEVLRKIYETLKTDLSVDWWDDMAEDQKKNLEKSAQQLKDGNGISHDDVKAKYPQWFTG
jgi:hypothetical protein